MVGYEAPYNLQTAWSNTHRIQSQLIWVVPRAKRQLLVTRVNDPKSIVGYEAPYNRSLWLRSPVSETNEWLGSKVQPILLLTTTVLLPYLERPTGW